MGDKRTLWRRLLYLRDNRPVILTDGGAFVGAGIGVFAGVRFLPWSGASAIFYSALVIVTILYAVGGAFLGACVGFASWDALSEWLWRRTK